MIDEDEDDEVDFDLPALENSRKFKDYNLSSIAIVIKTESNNNVSIDSDELKPSLHDINIEKRSSMDRMKDAVQIHNKTESANE